MMRLNLHLLVILLLLMGLPRVSHAARDYQNCTGFITSLPTTINTAGVWCLNQDLSYAATGSAAVSIGVDRVTIDCNDFTLDGTAAGVGTFSSGIRTFSNFFVTVRNCNIRGFFRGIELGTGYSNPAHYLVEDNRFVGNTHAGIQIVGADTIVRRNRVSHTGGSTNDPDAMGIVTDGSGDVLDNTVSDVPAITGGNGYAYGIRAIRMLGGSISGNRVRGVLKDGTGLAYAIYNAAGDKVVLSNNEVIGDSSANSTGLSCDAGGYTAKGNVINGFATGIALCSDGGNVIKP